MLTPTRADRSRTRLPEPGPLGLAKHVRPVQPAGRESWRFENHVQLADEWTSQKWEFWFALICQIVIVVGYFVFFRKEQLVRTALPRSRI